MNLDKYKDLLDHNTFDAIGEADERKSRYVSFKLCLSHLKNVNKPNFLEIGTTRSFVGGAFEGCNSDDRKYWNKDDFSKWDFGAGAFTLIFGQELPDNSLTTLDIVDSHIRRCKIMTDSLGIKCNHVVSDSVSFLKKTKQKFDLIYLDSGDMTPISVSEKLQLEEVKAIIDNNVLKPNGLILIDDVLNKTPREHGDLNNQYGKSTLSLPYLLKNGFQIIFEGYQYILQKQ